MSQRDHLKKVLLKFIKYSRLVSSNISPCRLQSFYNELSDINDEEIVDISRVFTSTVFKFKREIWSESYKFEFIVNPEETFLIISDGHNAKIELKLDC